MNENEPEQRCATRILIADDAGDVAAWMGILLRAHGYDVRTARGGSDAIRQGDVFQPHVVLMDIDMPEVDGCQAAFAMRGRDWGRAAVLIATTGWGEPEHKERTRAAGFDHHLVKPIQSERLLQLLSELFPYARARDEG